MEPPAPRSPNGDADALDAYSRAVVGVAESLAPAIVHLLAH